MPGLHAQPREHLLMGSMQAAGVSMDWRQPMLLLPLTLSPET